MTRIIIGFLLTTAALAIGYAGIRPQWLAAAEGRGEIARLQALHQELAELAARRDALTAEYNAIPESDLAKLRAIVPGDPETAKALGGLEAIARSQGMSIERVDFVTGRIAGEFEAVTEEGYRTLPLVVALKGTYDGLRGFLVALERSLRLMDVDEITFASAGPEARNPELSVSVKGRMYWR